MGQGPIGPQGPQGPLGPQGPKGDKGDKGFKGEDGSMDWGNLTISQKNELYAKLPTVVEFKGDQGLQGTMGPIGMTGTMGPIGTTGPIGLTGTQGNQGLPGIGFGVEGDFYTLDKQINLKGTKAFMLFNEQNGVKWDGVVDGPSLYGYKGGKLGWNDGSEGTSLMWQKEIVLNADGSAKFQPGITIPKAITKDGKKYGGGITIENDNGTGTHFNYQNFGSNYIRGPTQIDGSVKINGSTQIDGGVSVKQIDGELKLPNGWKIRTDGEFNIDHCTGADWTDCNRKMTVHKDGPVYSEFIHSGELIGGYSTPGLWGQYYYSNRGGQPGFRKHSDNTWTRDI